MIDGLKPYPEYKETKLPWLNHLPVGWNTLRGKGVFHVLDVRSASGKEEILTVSASDGVIPRRQKAVTMFMAKSYIGHKLCWPGDLVVNSLWAWMQGLGFSKYHGLISSAYSVYRPRSEFAQYWRFFHHLLRSAVYKWELQTRSKGVWLSRLQLSDLAFMDMPILIPPNDEATAIVKFLDHATRRLNRAILAKQKVIALLNEQKQVIIHRAVTRGLDTDVPLKPSGIPWLGDIPKHWETISLGAATILIQTGPFGSQLHSHEYIKDGVPVINPSHIINGCIVPDFSISVSQSKLNELERHKLCVGDIVAARRGELGRCALVTISENGWLCGTGSLLIRPNTNILHPAYLKQVFSSHGIHDSLCLASIGATMDNLNAGMVARLRIPLPALSEQAEIVELIEAEHRTQDAIVKNIEHQIKLLQEFRTRLIADVVTGKLDVREAARWISDETEADDFAVENGEFFNGHHEFDSPGLTDRNELDEIDSDKLEYGTGANQ